MGVLSYFKPKKEVGKVVSEKTPASFGLDVLRPATDLSSRHTSMSSRADTGHQDLRYDALANYLYQKQVERTWISSPGIDQGVVIRKSRDEYACCPLNLGARPDGFAAATKALNVRVSDSFYQGTTLS